MADFPIAEGEVCHDGAHIPFGVMTVVRDIRSVVSNDDGSRSHIEGNIRRRHRNGAVSD